MASIDDVLFDLKQLRLAHRVQLDELISGGARMYRFHDGKQIDITAAFLRQEEETIKRVNDAICRFEAAKERAPDAGKG
jgi:hypothetical protein